jgi:hypothetical protein
VVVFGATETGGGGNGYPSQVTTTTGNFDRDGRMVARVRQEGGGYWVARPRTIPEPPIESIEDAQRRAVNLALASLPLDPQTAARVNKLNRQYMEGLAKQEPSIFKRSTPPVNMLGGYRFPDAPVVDVGGIIPLDAELPATPLRASPPAPDIVDLTIPNFLRRSPPTLDDRWSDFPPDDGAA